MQGATENHVWRELPVLRSLLLITKSISCWKNVQWWVGRAAYPESSKSPDRVSTTVLDQSAWNDFQSFSNSFVRPLLNTRYRLSFFR